MASIAGPSSLKTGRSSEAVEKFPAQSSFIAEFEYDKTNMTLITHMKSGAIYEQKGIFTPTAWDALKTSQNHSKHWADNIKGKYQLVRVKVVKAPRSEIKTGRK